MENTIKELKVYSVAVQLSDLAWNIFKLIPKQFQYSTGDHFIRASDSVAANISEERELLESRIDIITQGMFETAHEILNTYDEIILHSELSGEVLWSVQESEQDSQFSYDSEDDNTE